LKMNIEESIKLIKRGTVEIIEEKQLREKLSQGKPLRVKLGVDPTSADLHLGHTVALKKLKQFQDLGHQAVFLIGDFTARIGDPSGRDETRPVIDKESIDKNIKTYQDQVFRILDKSKTEVVHNSLWLEALGIKGLLELTRKSTVAQMLQRADFKKRYTEGHDITLLEFMYPLLQAYDSVALNADIELGGSDQIFNLLKGRELQQDYGQDPQVVITMPLLEGTDGVQKMSKSYGNYIALNDSPKDMFGKIMSISDDLMYTFFELLTLEDMKKIKSMHPKEAKEHLAEIITAEYHGKEPACNERECFKKVFSLKEIPENMQECTICKKSTIVDVMLANKVVPSKKEAKRLLDQGAVTLDGKKIVENIEIAFPSGKDFLCLQVGKRRFLKLTRE
jgi:tyrosyl-tRNA synthetase